MSTEAATPLRQLVSPKKSRKNIEHLSVEFYASIRKGQKGFILSNDQIIFHLTFNVSAGLSHGQNIFAESFET